MGSGVRRVVVAVRSCARIIIVFRSMYQLGNGVMSISFNHSIMIDFSDHDFSHCIGFPY